MKIHTQTFTYFQSCVSFFVLLSTEDHILENVGSQTKMTVKVNGINCLVTNILQNIIFCSQQNKETQTSLKQHKGELNEDNFHFLVNYAFNVWQIHK